MKKAILVLLLGIGYCEFTNAQETAITYDRTIKQYFIAELIPSQNVDLEGEERMKVQQEHMANIRKLVQEKKMVMAGPFPQGGGLFFLSVGTQKEAEDIIMDDPTVIAGLNTFRVRPWLTEKGLFTLDNQ